MALTLSHCDFCQSCFACSCGIKQIPHKYQSKHCTMRMIEGEREPTVEWMKRETKRPQDRKNDSANKSEIKLSNEAHKQEIVTLEDDATHMCVIGKKSNVVYDYLNGTQYALSVFILHVRLQTTNEYTQKSMGKTIIAFLFIPNHYRATIKYRLIWNGERINKTIRSKNWYYQWWDGDDDERQYIHTNGYVGCDFVFYCCSPFNSLVYIPFWL